MDNVCLNDIELVQIKTNDLNHHLKRQNIDKNRKKEIKAKGGQFSTKKTLQMNLSQFHQRFMRTFFVQNFGAKTHKAECN